MVTDWITSVSTVVLVGITGVYVVLTHDMLQETRRQAALVQDPIIRVLPEEDVSGGTASFDLEVENSGVADVRDLKIYEDYFVSLTPPSGPITLNRFGAMITKPNSTIPLLRRGERQTFRLAFSDLHQKMTAFYTSDVAGHRMMVVRLLLRYRRLEDGKEFKTSKAYVIGGHGDFLMDYDERGMQLPGGPTFSDIKQALGVSVN